MKEPHIETLFEVCAGYNLIDAISHHDDYKYRREMYNRLKAHMDDDMVDIFLEEVPIFKALYENGNIKLSTILQYLSEQKTAPTYCKSCGVAITHTSKNKYCSKNCASHAPLSLSTKQKLSKIAKKAWEDMDGTKIRKSSEKRRQTLLMKYGVDNIAKLPHIQKKMVTTTRERYGVDNVAQSESIKQKIKETNLKRYGVANPFSSKEIRKKAEMTCIERYGVANPMYSEVIKHKLHDKKIQSERPITGYKYRKYTLPSGKTIVYQGYENHLFDHLLSTGDMTEDDFTNKKSDMIGFRFTYYGNDNQRHLYVPDCYIPKSRTFIEVKGDYTFDTGMYDGTLLKKMQSVITRGFRILVCLVSKDGECKFLSVSDIKKRSKNKKYQNQREIH